MNKKLFLIFFILIIFLIIFLLITLFIYNKRLNSRLYESFSNNDVDEEYYCGKFFSENSFCEYNVDDSKCNCKYQKDDSRYLFNSPESCCQNECSKRTESQCLDPMQGHKIPYYCNIGGQCLKYNGTVNESHIMANNCGLDPLNNQLLLPYSNMEECQKSIDPCDIYNDPKKTDPENKAECLKDFNCGYCTNDTGGGKCISGTASGANDLQKYFFCNPTSRSEKNKYIYGDHAATLLQPANIKSFSNIPS